MLRKVVGRAAVRAYRVRRPSGRRQVPAAARARRGTVRAVTGVDAVLYALAATCVAALAVVGTVWARPGPNPPIGYVVAVHLDPGVGHTAPDIHGGRFAWTTPGAGHVTVHGKHGTEWVETMPGWEAEQCLLGRAWRLETGCADPRGD